jgi:hypothetical protein
MMCVFGQQTTPLIPDPDPDEVDDDDDDEDMGTGGQQTSANPPEAERWASLKQHILHGAGDAGRHQESIKQEPVDRAASTMIGLMNARG